MIAILVALGVIVLLIALLSGRCMLMWYRFWDDIGK